MPSFCCLFITICNCRTACKGQGIRDPLRSQSNKGNIVAIDAPESLKKMIRSVQSIEVSFNHNSADQLDELHRLPMVNDAHKEGDKFKLYTEDPSEVIDAVVAYAHTHNLKVISITTLGPVSRMYSYG